MRRPTPSPFPPPTPPRARRRAGLASAAAGLLWLSCTSGPPGDGPSPTGDTGPVQPPVTEARGSLLVDLVGPWLGAPEGHSVIGAVFVEASDVANLAHCLLGRESWCSTELPASEGPVLAVDDPSPELIAGLSTLDAGSTVQVGPFVAERQVDEESGFTQYLAASDTLANPGAGSVGFRIAGGVAWPALDVDSVVAVPTRMALWSHAPTRSTTFHDADLVLLRWLPGTSGAVDLLVDTEVGATVRRVPDDGSFDLDLSHLGLSDGSPIELRLTRGNRGEVDLDGRHHDVTVQYGQRITGNWRTIGQREDLTGSLPGSLPDTCDQAQGAEPIEEGFYEGSFVGFANDLDPGVKGCTGFSATAADAILPVKILPSQRLTVNYQLLADDASVYLVSDCFDVSSCAAGADAFGERSAAGLETLEYINTSSGTERLYLVLDGLGPITDGFRLDVEFSALGGDVLENFCADAIKNGPIGPGFYDGTLADHINVLPGYEDPPCKSPGMAGGEGSAEIRLEPGRTLSAMVTTPGADPRLHLLTNCSVADSCIRTGGSQIEWTNKSAFTQTFFIVLDSATGIGEYALDVRIE